MPAWVLPIVGWVILTTCVMITKAIEQMDVDPLDIVTWLLLTLPTVVISLLSVYIFKNS